MAEFLCEKCGGPLTPSEELGRSCHRCLLSLAMPEDESESAPATLPPGTMVGRYRILRLIGEGGMGAVYEAEQEHPRRRVALKVIKPGLTSLELLRRFEHESLALGRLQHPGIAQIYEAGTDDTGYGPQPYFAMEFIHGETLRGYAEKHRLSTRARLELIARVCDAVHHAHQRGLIHRDLKPGNILVDQSGQPKILDFGVARLTDSDTKTTLQTAMGRIVGTLAYMSPEQALADPLELDTRSDVYSLGVILYELLASRLPYTIGRQIYEALEAIRAEDPARLSSIDRNYRGDIETIVAKALEKDKTRRYSSAAEFAADIQRHLRDEPIVARPPSAAYQLQKFTRRHKALVSGVAAVFVVLVVAVTAISSFAVKADRARTRAEQATAELATERDRADRGRDDAEHARDDAREQTKVAVEAAVQLERNKAEMARDRDRAIWASLMRESARVSASRTDDELAALLARQSHLINSRIPGQPRYLVEEALQRVAQSSPWTRVDGPEGLGTPVAFSANGTRLASSSPTSLDVWRLKGSHSGFYGVHSGTVNALAFSPDGEWFASGGQDGKVGMWDLRKPTSPPPGVVPLSPNFTVRDDRSDPVSALAFSRDGTRLALGTFKGAWVADLRNPRVPPLKLAGRPFGDLSFTSIDFSPDGAHVAGGTTQGDLIVWNLRDQSLRFFQTLADPVTAVAFSSDGKRLASAGSGPDFNIRLWDPTNHNVPSVLLRGQDSRANALAFSPDVKQLVSVGEDGRLRFWNLSDPRTLPQVVQAHVGAAISVAFLRDGKDLATAGRDHVMRIWNLRAGAPLGLLRTRQDQHFAVQSLTFSPDNAYLVSASADRTARVWNLRNLSVPPVSLLHEEAGPQGAAGAQGPVGPRGIFSDPYVSVVRPIVTSFSADSARLVTATSGAVRLWNTGDLSQPTRVWTGVTPGDASSPVGNSVALVAIHQRGPVLSRVISEPLALKQWDLRSEVSQQIRADLAVFSDDLTLVASPAPNNSIQVWNLRQRDVPPLRLAGHRDYVTALAFSHDGALLASVGGDRAVRVWDLKKPDVPIFEFEGFGYFVQFSPDDTRLVANGTGLRDVLMWFLREPGHPKLTFNGGTAAIRSVAFSRDGTFFALGDVDGDVWLHRLWSGAADSLCTRVTRNLSVQEWRYYLGESVPYERTCPGLPAG